MSRQLWKCAYCKQWRTIASRSCHTCERLKVKQYIASGGHA
jgi:hypothetical protein